jgi:hydrogenase maturation protease
MIHVENGTGDNPPGTIKVIGIGQSLRGDDGAGVAAVRYWNDTYQLNSGRGDIQVELAELAGIGLLELLEGAKCAILVDAVKSGATPGTIHQLSEGQVESFGTTAGSAHGWGVAETLSLGRMLSHSNLPEKIFLLGIEAVQLTLGDELSPEVQNALPEAARMIEQHVIACLNLT